MEHLTDWRGNDYSIGDTVLYPRASGRSVEIQEATVVEIREVLRDQEKWTWRKVRPGEAAEATRVIVQPTGRGSRGFHRTDSRTVYLDADGQPTTYELAAPDGPPRADSFGRSWQPKRRREESVTPKAVTIIDIENITKVGPRPDTEPTEPVAAARPAPPEEETSG